MKSDPRKAAINALSKWERDGKYINLELDSALERERKHGLSGADCALAAAIMYGVSERKLTLDREIVHLTGRKLSELDSDTLASLRVGLCQLAYMDKIPPFAAVNETVSASPARSRGLVNASLRRFIREGAKITLPERDGNEAEYLSVCHSVPEWIIESWICDYGDDAEAIAASANSVPPVTLRVNTLKTDQSSLLARLAVQGIEARTLVSVPDMIEIASGKKITEISGYSEGEWFVQDPASRLASLALDVKAGDTVVDVCSAPGGKSFSMALDMGDSGKVYSRDLHENKVRLIRRGAERLGIGSITAEARDSSKTDESLVGKADRVLCDVPCSGLGVIAKKPDIRYKEEADVKRLPEVQYAILAASVPYVKDGGVLVYSTCTLREAENGKIREKFLSEHADFEPWLPETFPIKTEDGQITLMPHKHGTDGFYIAGFKKK